jgi:hypothetical protein
MAHPRRAIIDAIRTALEAAATPTPLVVYEADQSSELAPCWQIHVRSERRGENTTRAQYERLLEFQVCAIGTTPTERDDMSEALEAALLGVGALGAFEVEWGVVNLSVPEEQVGERIYPATYSCVAQSFTSR